MTPVDPTPEPITPPAPVETPPEPVAIAPDTPPDVAENPAAVAEVPPQVETPAATVETPTLAIIAQPVPVVLKPPQAHDLSRMAQDLQIRKGQVEAVVVLLDEGNTVPFITRYRKERTGGLNEDALRRIQFRLAELRSLAERKQTILKSLANQAKLNDELIAAVLDAETPKRLDDLYLPFRPKKRTLATEAKERGREPLAQAIWNRDPAVANLPEVLAGMIDPDVSFTTQESILEDVKHILAEVIAEWASVRGAVRAFGRDTGILTTRRVEGLPEDKGKEFTDYKDFHEPVRMLPPHRILAINRGERENVLKVKVVVDSAKAKDIAGQNLPLENHPHLEYLRTVVDDAVDRLLLPSIERELRRELTERAHEHAVHVFARNLRSLLLAPPLRGRRVLAIDPGIRTGCKLAVMDETGKLLEHDVIYPLSPQRKVAESKLKLEYLIRKHQTDVIAIGNGTGCRDAEQIVSDLIAFFRERRINPPPVSFAVEPTATAATPEVTAEAEKVENPADAIATVIESPMMLGEATTLGSTLTGAAETVQTTTGEGAAIVATQSTPMPVAAPPAPVVPPPPSIDFTGLDDAPEALAYIIVNEAGASDYSASPVAKDEFPNLDATTRGTVSIGRRLQDPLAELVKIDPSHVGVGLYQHDVKPKNLKDTLESVVESCVNHVGVDINTASVPLLRFVSGFNQLVARELVEYREAKGAFTSREQLKEVPQLGENRFTQAAGFLKIIGGTDPLDTTRVHPESYPIARAILAELGFTSQDLLDKTKLEQIREKMHDAKPGELAVKLEAGEPTVWDIFAAIERPGVDPRDDLPPPVFKTGVLKIEDLNVGMELRGTVLNVVPFGAFVDVGVKESGLVHISQLANRYIKSPYDVVAVGDVVTVWVMEVKAAEKKISLTMMDPTVDRRPPEPPPPMQQRPQREPRPDQREQRGPAGPPRPQRPSAPMAPRPQAGPPRQGRFAQPGAWRKGPGGPPAQGQGGPTQQGEGAQPAPGTAPPPGQASKPGKPKPVVKLSSEQKIGKAALTTFGELSAFFKVRTEPEPETPPPTPPETPPATPEVPPTNAE